MHTPRPIRLSFVILLLVIPAFFLVSSARPVSAQTVGLIDIDDRASEGYTLFTPLDSDTTYLIDIDGWVVNKWSGGGPPVMAYLLEDGSLLRAWDPKDNDVLKGGGSHGIIDRFDWDGNLTWQFRYSNDDHRLHHDIEPLPNGNILMTAWEARTRDEVHEAGGDTTQLKRGKLWPDHIIEVKPVGETEGEIVWEWHSWDHMIQNFDSTKANYGVVSDHPELLDLNRMHRGIPDWIHTNGVDYNSDLDQIVLSTPFFNELWVIDHSTTTEEAASHSGGLSGLGGDLLYRWGNPVEYGLGQDDDQVLFFQHDAQWIKPGLPGAGNMLVFNNRRTTSDDNGYSSVDELTPPIDDSGAYIRDPGAAFGPDELVWSYSAPNKPNFYGWYISGVQRLPNGNTLVTNGPHGALFEVTPDGDEVWRYENPATEEGIAAQGETVETEANRIFKVRRYAPDFPAFATRDVTPIAPIVPSLPPQSALAIPADGSFGNAIDVELSWSETPGASEYRLQVSESASFDSLLVEVDGLNAPSHTLDSLLDYGTVYYWRVRASNQYGEGRSSDVFSFVTSIGGPMQVALVAPADKEILVGLLPSLVWDSVASATSYQVQVATDSEFVSIVFDQDSIAATTFEPENLASLSRHFWRVRATNAGSENWSEAWSFLTSVPQVVLALPEDAASGVAAYTRFAWESTDDAVQYSLQISTDERFETIVLDAPSLTEDRFVPPDPLDYSQTYHWRVRAAGDLLLGKAVSLVVGPWSEARSFTTAVGTATEAETTLPTVFALHGNYPNPFNPSTTISYELPEAATIRLVVFDALGRIVGSLVDGHQSAGRYSVTWDADRATSGVYFVRMEAGTFSQSRRMLLMK